MSFYHAVVWIDHQEAHVIHFDAEASASEVLRPHSRHQRLHHKRGSIGAGRISEDQSYYNDVVQALKDAGEILIVGPATAKLALIKHMHRHDYSTSERVVGVETVDHPSDPQLLHYARKYFSAADRLRPQ
jgi:stalled ribosome rescue protein Dom34